MGASSRLRSYQYIKFLESSGYEVTVRPLYNDKYLENLYNSGKRKYLHIIYFYLRRIVHLYNIDKYDLIWIEKELFPYLPRFMESVLKFSQKPYIVDYDDAVPHNYNQSPNLLVNIFLKNKLSSLLKNASIVITGNKYLKTICLEAGALKVKIIPTVVDTARYKIKRKHPSELIQIGWIGTPNTSKYIDVVRNTLLQLREKYNVGLIVIGDDSFFIEGIPIKNITWEEGTEINSLNEIDIGIMPLHKSLWEHGKCGYKLIQYLALGKPVVATPIGVNLDIVNKKVGFLADNDIEWYKSLEKLILNPELRELMGNAGIDLVNNKYSKSIAEQDIKKVLTNILNTHEI